MADTLKSLTGSNQLYVQDTLRAGWYIRMDSTAVVNNPGGGYLNLFSRGNTGIYRQTNQSTWKLDTNWTSVIADSLSLYISKLVAYDSLSRKAQVNHPFVTIGNPSSLTGERAITGATNLLTITDNGVNSTVVLTPDTTRANPNSLTTRNYVDSLDALMARKATTITVAANAPLSSSAGAQDLSANRTWTLSIDTATVATQSDLIDSSAVKAQVNHPYVTIGNIASLSGERALTGTSNQITVTDNGANSTAVLSLPQNYHTAATPTLGSLTLGGTSGNTLVVETSGLVYDATNNRVGINTASPSSSLHISTQAATITSGSESEIIGTIQAQPTSSSSASIRGMSLTAQTQSGNAQTITGDLRGIDARTTHQGTGTLSTIYGLLSVPSKSNTGAITNVYSIYSRVDNSNATAAITSAYGLYVENFGITGAITNPWGVYVNSTTLSNYFGGNTGIGDASPSALLTVGTSDAFQVTSNADISSTQKVRTSGSPTAFTLTGGAHTTLTASTEATDVNYNLARAVQFATGALATQRAFRIQAPTYGFVGASTLTSAITLDIDAAPTAGTNATITNPIALRVAAGATRLEGGFGMGVQPTSTYGGYLYKQQGSSFGLKVENDLTATENNPQALISVESDVDDINLFANATGATDRPGVVGLSSNVNTSWRFWNIANTNMDFYTNNAKVGVFDNSGNFGIGNITPGASLDIQNKYKVTSSGTVSEYNDIVTVESGTPAAYASVNLTAQTAAVGTTTLYAVPASGAGQYELSWNAKVTTAATTSSTLGALTIVYTDPDNVAQTITCAAQVAAGTIATTSTGNTTTTVLLGMKLLLNCKASTNITYAFAYASSGATPMAYNLHVVLHKD